MNTNSGLREAFRACADWVREHPRLLTTLTVAKKTITWRLIAGADTVIAGWWVTGDLRHGAMIAGAEALSKTFLYSAHEAAWLQVGWGKNQDGSDSKKRSLAKAVTYRIAGSLDTGAMTVLISNGMSVLDPGKDGYSFVKAVTKSFDHAKWMFAWDFTSKLGLYFGHERAWNKILQHQAAKAAAQTAG